MGRWCLSPSSPCSANVAAMLSPLQRLLGDSAGSQAGGTRVSCPGPPAREKLPGSSWPRGRKKEEKPEIKKQNKTKQNKNYPVQIHSFALRAVPSRENIPEGIFHYCSATEVSLLKTFWMRIFSCCWKSSSCVSCCIFAHRVPCCLALKRFWHGFNA